jgi:hypothetical protein
MDTNCWDPILPATHSTMEIIVFLFLVAPPGPRRAASGKPHTSGRGVLTGSRYRSSEWGITPCAASLSAFHAPRWGAHFLAASYQWVRAAWRRFPLATFIGISGAGQLFHRKQGRTALRHGLGQAADVLVIGDGRLVFPDWLVGAQGRGWRRDFRRWRRFEQF